MFDNLPKVTGQAAEVINTEPFEIALSFLSWAVMKKLLNIIANLPSRPCGTLSILYYPIDEK